jgi:hypothetical protein
VKRAETNSIGSTVLRLELIFCFCVAVVLIVYATARLASVRANLNCYA